MRAVWADVAHKQVVEGGSTITQQFIKNAYVDNQRSIARKLQGGGPRLAARAALVARTGSSTAYLNTIYFGNGAYGIEQAARTYFQHSAREADAAPRRRCSPALPSDPTAYDPATQPARARGASATSRSADAATRG